MRQIFIFATVVTLVSGAAFAQSKNVTIEEFRPATGKILTYDAKGALQQKTLDAKSMTLPTPAVDERGDGSFFRIETADGPVWLRRSSLRLKERAGTVTECEGLRKLQSASEAANPQRTAGSRALTNCEDPK